VFTRKLNDVTHAVPEVVEAVRALPVRQIVLDGEAIVLREWRPSRTIPGHHAPLRTTPRRRRPTR
jgi:ATP-dependent DNA ligase